MEIKEKHVLHIEFNNLTCIFLARVTGHLSISRCSIPSLRRNGGSLLWVDSPSGFHPQLLFTFHIPHMSYQHNLYHLTHVAYQTCSVDGTFPKCPMEFHSKPISKIGENLPMKFGSCRPSHMVFLQCVPLAHSSSSQTVNHCLTIQSKFDCSITKQWH